MSTDRHALIVDALWGDFYSRSEANTIADELLPLIDRMTRDRAATELRNIASELRRCSNNASGQQALIYNDAADRAADHAGTLDVD